MMFFGRKNKYMVFRDDESSIEPEEIFFDAKLKKGFAGGDADLAYSKLEVPLGFRDFGLIIFLTAIFAATMLFYDFYAQFFLSDKYFTQAKNNSTRIRSIKAPRGIIYDRNMAPLVSNEPSFDLVAIPKDLPSDKEVLDGYIEKFHLIIGISSNELKAKFGLMDRMSILPVILKENIGKDAALSLEMRIDDFEGIKIERNIIRDYKDPLAFSHILGYTAKISGEELKSNSDYLPTDYVGKMGVEQSYENFLKGKNGKYVISLDARHNILKESLDQESEIGDSVVLSVDAGLQSKAYGLLDDARKKFGMGAALVAINPKNGNILAAVSNPGYDSNLFSHGISYDDYQKLANDKSKPLFNRFLAGKYPSGSTIKPFLAAAALQEKVITPERQILSTGSISVGSNPETAFVFRDWKEGGHGMVNMFQAIAQSVNTYFYTIGGGYYDIKGLGPERIEKYLKFFGFGGKLDIDMSGESSGLVPTPEWKKNKMNDNWYIGDTYNLSIGQGYIGVTPMQLATGISAVANGGTLYRPRFVEKIVDTGNNTAEEYGAEIISENFIDKKNIDAVRKGMRDTVLVGSARSLNELPIEIAGKTGTAQFGGEDKTHAWFIAFAPYEDPEIALAILVEGGGEGSSTAVPIAREIFNWLIENRKLTIR